MSAAAVGLQQVIFLDADARGVLLPATRSEIVGSAREGNSLVLQLADGRTMLIVDLFLQKDAILLVRGEFGAVSALEISRKGEIVGLEPISLAELEEMFGVGREEVVVEAAPAPEEEVEEAEPEVEEEAPDEVEAVDEPKDEEGGSLGQLAGLLAAGTGLAVAGGGGADDEASGPLRQYEQFASELGEFGFSATQEEKIQTAMETVMEPGSALPRGLYLTRDASGGTLRVELDANGDATADALRVLTFDRNFEVKRVEFDDAYEGGDFVAERRVEFRAGDSVGNVLTVYDDNADGTLDRAEQAVTGADGSLAILYDDSYDGIAFWASRAERVVDDSPRGGSNAVTVEVYEDLDGGIEGTPVRVETRVSDSGGRLVEVWADDRTDGNLDGSADVRIVHHYSALGQRIRSDLDFFGDGTVERSEFNFEGDIRVDRAESYTWDSRGRLVRIGYDDDNDGTADWSAELVYVQGAGPSASEQAAPAFEVAANPQGSATERGATSLAVDEDGDGAYDRTETYSYISRGFAYGRLESVVYDDDNSGDGTNERRVVFAYDEDNAEQELPSYAYTDLLDDGTFERAVKNTYETSADGRLKKVEYDDGYDGTAFQADRAQTRHHNGLEQMIRAELDDDADGTVDRVEHYAYGRDGRIAEARFDEDGDGTLDRVERYSWNAKGQRAGRTYDNDYSGSSFSADRIESYEYDAKGRLSRTLLDRDADGTYDSSTATTYNARGQTETVRHDFDHDGVVNQVDIYAYDGKGRLTSLVRQYDTDDGGGSNFERAETLLYDGGVLIERQSVQYPDGDGAANQREWRSYDEDGVLSGTRFLYDSNGDGTANREEISIYEGGSLVSRTVVWDDFDGSPAYDGGILEFQRIVRDVSGSSPLNRPDDGTPDLQEDTSYGTSGLATTGVQVFDQDGDGAWDRMIRATYENGMKRELRVDADYDGIPENFNADQIAVYEYDEDGILAKVRYDGDADGVFDRIETYIERDEEGRLVLIAHDGDADSRPDDTTDRIETRTYNSGGWHETSVFEYNDDADSSVERRQTVTYDRQGRVASVEFDGFYDGDGNRDGLDTEDPDGIPHLREDYTWNALGQLASKTSTFYGADGTTAAVVESETYDEQGRVVQVTYDGIGYVNVGDGTLEAGESQPLRWWDPESAVQDANGTPNRLERSEFDPLTGALSRSTVRYDDDQDGTGDREVRHEFFRDGSYIRTNLWDDDAGARSETWHFNADGGTTQIVYDRNGDGTRDESEVFIYDPQGRHVGTVTTEYEDGTAATLAVTETFVPATGRTSSIVRDIGADGTDDWREDYTYDANGILAEHTAIEHGADGTAAERVETTIYRVNDVNGDDIPDDLDGDGTLDDPDGDGTPEARVETSVDIGDDGTVNWTERFEYDTRNRLTGSTREVYGSDGETVESTETRVFDRMSRVTRVERDLDNDGTADIVVTSSYDGVTGQLREFHVRDRDGNGTADHAEMRLYGSDERLLRLEVDENYDGTRANFNADYIESREYDDRGFTARYDLDGNGGSERTHVFISDGPHSQTVRIDDTGNGVPNLIEIRSADAFRRVTRIEYFDDGIVAGSDDYDRVTEHEYADSDRRVDLTRFDDDGDGSYDRSETYDYRSNGRIRTIGFDDDYNGIADRYVHWNYSSRGLVSRIDHDANGDGVVESREIFQYTGIDRVERVIHEYDRNLDGTFERDLTAVYGYNQSSQIARIEYDTDSDGSADEIEERIYDAFRRLSRVEYNLDGAIGVDRSDVIAYDGNSDRRISRNVEWNSEGDAAAEIVERRIYDQRGRVVRVEYYDDGDVADPNDYDRTSAYAYSGADRRVATAEFDTDGNGLRDWWASYTYRQGNQIEKFAIERDTTGNGIVGESEVHHFMLDDPRSVLIEYDGVSRERFDAVFPLNDFGNADYDGTVDLRQRITYTNNIRYDLPSPEEDVETSPGMDGSEARTLSEIAGVVYSRVAQTESDFGYDQLAAYTYGASDRLDSVEVTRTTDDAIVRYGPYSTYSHDADFTYRADGKIDRVLIDTNGDGVSDQVHAYYYNGDFIDRVNIGDDSNGDGTVDGFGFDVAYRYSDGTGGTLVSVTDLRSGDEGVYSYDADGTLSHVDFDLDADTTTDRTDTYNFRSIGANIDSNGDGVRDQIEIYSYGPDGILAQVDFDTNADGTADYIEIYRYNSEGAVVNVRVDDNADGSVDQVGTYVYAGFGIISLVNFDTNGDGTADWIETYRYNGSGVLTHIDIDTNADSTADRIETYRFNSDGDVTSIGVDTDANGAVDLTNTYSYMIRLDSVDIDLNGDGTADQKDVYSYDGRGNQVAVGANVNPNGVDMDRIDTFHYSEAGNLTRIEVDLNNDGTVDLRQHHADGDERLFDWIEASTAADGTFDDIRIAYDVSVPPPEVDGTVLAYDRLEIYNEGYETVATAADTSSDGEVDTLTVSGGSGFRFEFTEEVAAWLPNLGTLILSDMTHLTIADAALLAASSVDGVVDERYAETPYTLYVRHDQNRSPILDTINLAGGFARDASQDEESGGDIYHAYASDNGLVRVDADITVTISDA